MATLKSTVHPLAEEFTFAGFSFPKYLFTLPRASMAKRLERARNPVCGHCYHSPTPAQAGRGFYLESDGMPGLRWEWADKFCRPIGHTGWFTNEFGDGEKIRGLVMRLPKGRGFLAGWSMGEGMASSLSGDIYETAEEAARAADSKAESVAEREREREAEFRAQEESREREAVESFANEVAA